MRFTLRTLTGLLLLALLPSAAAAQSTGTVMPNPKFVATDNNGNPCNGCKLYTYTSGTTTPLATYSDSGLTTPNANPVVLDSAGRATIFLSASSYKFALTTSAGVTLWTVDGVQSVGLTGISSTLNRIADGRLTLTSVTPVTRADVTGATTLYYTPYAGSRIALYDGSAWQILAFAELSLSLGSDAANTNYDLFAYSNSGVVALERLAWTNNTTRATALTLQDGVLVKSGAPTRRYLGTYRTTSTIGQTEDSVTKRFVWNYLHRVPRALRVIDTTDTWTYTTATWRQARASTANQVEVVVGWDEVVVSLLVTVSASNSSAGVNVAAGIGADSTSAPASGLLMSPIKTHTIDYFLAAGASLEHVPVVGYHYYAWLEYSEAVGTTTWRGDGGVTYLQSGLSGTFEG